MTTLPYVGVTGIVTQDDAQVVGDAGQILKSIAPSHRLMAGVLVSHRGIRGEETPSRRYPHVNAVEGLLKTCAERGLWPCVHYNTRAGRLHLGPELELLVTRFPSMRGLQLNVGAPDAYTLRVFAERSPHIELILQVNNSSLHGLGDQYGPMPPVDYILRYPGVKHALLDASGGNGREIGKATGQTIGETYNPVWSAGVRLGYAGGLGPKSEGLLAGLEADLAPHGLKLRHLSCDAESGVRSPAPDPLPGEKHQDDLDWAKVITYVSSMARCIAS